MGQVPPFQKDVLFREVKVGSKTQQDSGGAGKSFTVHYMQ